MVNEITAEKQTVRAGATPISNLDYLMLTHLTSFVARMGPYFVSPVVAGLDKISEDEYEPVVCTYDSIGCADSGGNF